MEREIVLFSDLYECFEPKEHFSEISLKNKWRAIELDTSEYSGRLISSIDGMPEDISFDPKLKGWYKILIHLPGRSSVYLKLSGDDAFICMSAVTKRRYLIEEVLWKCADMTDQSIILSKKLDAYTNYSVLSAIKFIPMNDEEVAEYKREQTRRDTKRIYATDDLHNRLAFINQNSYDDWRAVAINYEDSDIEWLSVETLATLVSNHLAVDNIDDFAFPTQIDRHVQESIKKFDMHKAICTVVDQCKKMGIKSSVSMRMGGWGMPFPYDQFYFDCDFVESHPEWRTRDRNGDEIRAMSYAYPEVRKFLIDELVECARSECDAVTIMAHRGIPYVLFEEPVARRFYELYGEYPYELPLDEERLNKLHCDIMTEYVRELREALDKEFGKNRVEIHFRSIYSLYDSKYVGLDAERWAKEGLISAIISYPQRVHELLGGDVWKDDSKEKLDLDKYTNYVRTSYHVNMRPCDFETIEPIVNYRGELCGPKSQRERVEEWMELERKYGVKVYFEILPRHLTSEEFKSRALDLYDCGAERIALWDTYSRAAFRSTWATARRLGHKDELKERNVGEGVDYRTLFMLKLGDRDLNRFNPDWGG
ncbi:MAG: hypothetical protein J6L83_10050 [Clostridia bacterium]|nr:hypothetical protein [Clostridia bacterium]